MTRIVAAIERGDPAGEVGRHFVERRLIARTGGVPEGETRTAAGRILAETSMSR
ncbi:MAG: hypothetical protein ACE5GC_07610 [Acidimicrobiia bacterium]